MRKTKIVCTIGPSCDDEQTLKDMCLAGMNVARLNFSHGTHEEHRRRIDMIRRVREELDLPIAILLDTKGPEYRIGTFAEGKIFLKDGDEFIFTTEDIIGDGKRVSVSYKALPADMSVGDKILLNNGLVVFEVTWLTDTEIGCRVLIGGELSNRKSMSFPNKVLKQTYLSDYDKQDILFGIENEVDFIACSFVSCAQDLKDVKEFLLQNGGEGIDLIAKIENRSGVDNITEISRECDGIMIGRGDMGVEIPFEELPSIQKYLITKCRLLGKRVITATEMLESMIQNPRPTRAEISDVANAVYDGTSAIMLSGETAAGKYPVLTVATMSKIAEETEKNIDYEKFFRNAEFLIRNTVDAISHATCGMAIDIHAKAIGVSTLSGITARMISRFRCPVDIVGLTTDERTWRKLALSWGVLPVMTETYTSPDVLFYNAKLLTQTKLGLTDGDKLVLTGGMTNGTSGNTDMIRVETVKDSVRRVRK
ncbi:MAG: pyruvate kinase [Ruminococcaceae bacterium]|nr:pyruvate kinase [Oscillospiraceae bacterium]